MSILTGYRIYSLLTVVPSLGDLNIMKPRREERRVIPGSLSIRSMPGVTAIFGQLYATVHPRIYELHHMRCLFYVLYRLVLARPFE